MCDPRLGSLDEAVGPVRGEEGAVGVAAPRGRRLRNRNEGDEVGADNGCRGKIKAVADVLTVGREHVGMCNLKLRGMLTPEACMLRWGLMGAEEKKFEILTWSINLP